MRGLVETLQLFRDLFVGVRYLAYVPVRAGDAVCLSFSLQQPSGKVGERERPPVLLLPGLLPFINVRFIPCLLYTSDAADD